MRVGSGVILFQLAGFLTSALADFYFAKHIYWGKVNDYYVFNKSAPPENELALIYEVCPPVILFESRLSQNSRMVSLPLPA